MLRLDDRSATGGGALTTGMDQGIHPTRLKRLGRHRSYAVLDEYLKHGDAFEEHPPLRRGAVIPPGWGTVMPVVMLLGAAKP
ncbi:hypothetical protein [Belnapia rosea]|uniref:hypothetical protein n=1 Tax=Belnapia rosea TaxID=938405 RepID=UPI001FE01314|nr:hypothetical protein [Belnapia rosea]